MLLITDTAKGKLYRVRGWADQIRRGQHYLLPVDASGTDEISIALAKDDIPEDKGGSFIVEEVTSA